MLYTLNTLKSIFFSVCALTSSPDIQPYTELTETPSDHWSANLASKPRQHITKVTVHYCQSAYYWLQCTVSTIFATIRVLSDLLDAVDCGDTIVLVLLDLMVAFNTGTTRPSLKGCKSLLAWTILLSWFRSYLAGRRQHVRCGGKTLSYFWRHLWGTTKICACTNIIHYIHSWPGTDRRQARTFTPPVWRW